MLEQELKKAFGIEFKKKNADKKVNNKDVEKLYFEFEKNSLNVNLISENYNIHIFGDSLYRIKKDKTTKSNKRPK